MRILLDFTQIPLVRTGVGVYADHLLTELAECLGAEDELYVLAQDDDQAVRATAAGSRVRYVTIASRIFRNRFALLVYEQLALPLLLRRMKIDVIHSLHYTFPLLSRLARVVTVHDLTFFLWPKMHTRGRRMFFRPFIRAALRDADCVLFVSDSTRNDADRMQPNPRQKRFVAPLGVEENAFVPPSHAIAPALAELGVRAPYLLFIGTIEPRKNVVRLIEAFEQLAAEWPQITLVLAGKTGWHSAEFDRALSKSPTRDRILRLGYVTDSQKQTLLAGAAVLVYPSLYEGFGLPVLEAMALGVPVVTSNVSSLPEVAGEAAMLVNPESPSEIAAAIHTILTDAELAAKLSTAGKERAHLFRWKETAARTYAAYRAACRAD